MPVPSTSILNNLISPGARGSRGKVAQEEPIDKTIPLNNMPIITDRIGVSSFCSLSSSLRRFSFRSHFSIGTAKMVAETKKGIKQYGLIP